MEVRANAHNGAPVIYEEPEQCPICKHAIKPEVIHRHFFRPYPNKGTLTVTHLCPHCYKAFLSVYDCFQVGAVPHRCILDYTAPIHHEDQVFDEEIEALSPRFVKIYNQALAAEESSLDEIAGIGYRKALEFLVKDYCISRNPSEAETIKTTFLSNCLKTYVANDSIKTLATKAAWIGNDETHYVRQIEDRDIQDMKRFIRAMVHFIEMELIVEDAASISHA